ncbi:hypothetical protein DAD70_08075 [Streptococcus agalactiae]|nr:hypothetical protein DAD70_08075 [Streptococcus agalactiae]
MFRHSQYSPFRLFIVFLRLTSTTGILFNQLLLIKIAYKNKLKRLRKISVFLICFYVNVS